MHKLIAGGIVAAALAGCAPDPTATKLRDPEALISSASLFDPARFGGTWQVVSSGVPGCAGAQKWVWDGTGGYQVSGIDCAGAAKPLADRIVLTGPGGRLAARTAFGGEPIFVMWVDQDYRIAALGTPSGRWGMILSRQSPARPDLLKAAREVLDFNGYNLAKVAP
jgi:apolipoprotein D and lipocalin family protein